MILWAFWLNDCLWRRQRPADPGMVCDIWSFWNMFNLRIIMANLTALSITANCNYLRIDHCHTERAARGRFCVQIENIQSKCQQQHERQPRAPTEQGFLTSRSHGADPGGNHTTRSVRKRIYLRANILVGLHPEKLKVYHHRFHQPAGQTHLHPTVDLSRDTLTWSKSPWRNRNNRNNRNNSMTAEMQTAFHERNMIILMLFVWQVCLLDFLLSVSLL